MNYLYVNNIISSKDEVALESRSTANNDSSNRIEALDAFEQEFEIAGEAAMVVGNKRESATSGQSTSEKSKHSQTRPAVAARENSARPWTKKFADFHTKVFQISRRDLRDAREPRGDQLPSLPHSAGLPESSRAKNEAFLSSRRQDTDSVDKPSPGILSSSPPTCPEMQNMVLPDSRRGRKANARVRDSGRHFPTSSAFAPGVTHETTNEVSIDIIELTGNKGYGFSDAGYGTDVSSLSPSLVTNHSLVSSSSGIAKPSPHSEQPDQQGFHGEARPSRGKAGVHESTEQIGDDGPSSNGIPQTRYDSKDSNDEEANVSGALTIKTTNIERKVSCTTSRYFFLSMAALAAAVFLLALVCLLLWK